MQGCDAVIHLAAEISVPYSIHHPKETEYKNTIGTIQVLEAMRKNNVPVIVFASSAAVYGPSEICPKKTDMLPEPISPYAISKLSGEFYLQMFAREYGIRSVITRFFNVFGERQNPKSAYAAAVPIFISKALTNEPITVYGDGEQTRDFIYVKDLARYIGCLAERGSGVYNIGYGKGITINRLVQMILEKTGSSSRILFAEKRLGDVKYSFADVSKLQSEVQIPCIGFSEGLDASIRYYREK